MVILEDTFTAALAAVASSTAALPLDVAAVRPLGDDELLGLQQTLADAHRTIDACQALVAGEVEHRSRRELGYDGLAQRSGFRTPEALVQHMTGSTARDAAKLVHVGTILHNADPTTPTDGQPASSTEPAEPWLREVGIAVVAGTLTVDAARGIQIGLGAPSPAVTVDDLTDAVATLLGEVADLHADAFLRRARDLRDALDAAGVAATEAAIHEQRALRRFTRPNGARRYIIDTDLETGAYLDDVFDKLTAPRRGVRFTNPDDMTWADAIETDPRTLDQYTHDAFTDLLRVGVDADHRAKAPGRRRILGSQQPAVRVLVAAPLLASRSGRARIEGTTTPISIATAERIACANGIVAIQFDGSRPLNLGRDARLFSPAQRIALAARDGGCRFGDCERPPEWCEAHHTKRWHRDHGLTDIDDGILLCRFHHLLLHNNGWEIERHDDHYTLIPPATVDPSRSPRPMLSKSRALQDLLDTV